MPTKLGKGGAGEQSYVPKGNGDASGEYGDNATGSNSKISQDKIKETNTQTKTIIETPKNEIPKMTLSKPKAKYEKGVSHDYASRTKEDNDLFNALYDKIDTMAKNHTADGRDDIQKQITGSTMPQQMKDKLRQRLFFKVGFATIGNFDNDRFYGKGNWKANGRDYTFKHDIDNDNIIVATSNVKKIKDSYVMIVGKNKAIYVKDWAIKPVYNWDKGISGYLVKVNRNYFKPYTFKTDFEEYVGDSEDTFDSLKEVAKSQDKENIKWRYNSGTVDFN